LPGCFAGSVAELARGWLDIARGVADVTEFACGGGALLDAVGALVAEYRLAGQTRAAPLAC